MSKFTKAYDFKEYLAASKENLLAQGVDLAEDVLEKVVKSQLFMTKDWINASAEITPTPIDNIVASQLSMFDKAIEGINIDLNKNGV